MKLNSNGFYDLGHTQIPPVPPALGMTDVLTGKVWYLVVDTQNYNGHMALVDTLPSSQLLTARVFKAWDFVYLETFGLALGVYNEHLIALDQKGDSGAGPFAIDNSGNKQLLAQVYAAVLNGNFNRYDHLTFDLTPNIFFGLTDNITGKVWYVGSDDDNRIVMVDTLPALYDLVKLRIKVYGKFNGPAVNQFGIQLGLSNGHMFFDIGANQNVLNPTLSFNINGKLTTAEQFFGAWVQPRYVADQEPDHLAHATVVPQLT